MVRCPGPPSPPAPVVSFTSPSLEAGGLENAFAVSVFIMLAVALCFYICLWSPHEHELAREALIATNTDFSPHEHEPASEALRSSGAIEAVIFEGGGTKGMVYAGCIQRFEEENLLKDVRYFAGTSAGSQTAILMAAGYTGKELRDVMTKAPWDLLLDGSDGFTGFGRGLYRLCTKFGYYKGDFLERYLDHLLEKKLRKKKITFKEFHERTGKTIRLGVCNVATRKFEFLDHKSNPNVALSEAARASSSIPLVFVPKVIESVLYVDGGLQGNLPATAFDEKKLKNGLAFHLLNGKDYAADSAANVAPPPKPPKSFKGFVMTCLDMYFCHHAEALSAGGIEQECRLNHSPEGPVTRHGGMKLIKINTGAHSVLETKLTEQEIAGMIESGTEAADRFLQNPGSEVPRAQQS